MTLPNRGGDSAPDARNPVRTGQAMKTFEWDSVSAEFLDLNWSDRNKKHDGVSSNYNSAVNRYSLFSLSCLCAL